MTESQIIQSASQMDIFEKQKYYSAYLSTMLGLIHSSEVIDLDGWELKENKNERGLSPYHGHGKPDKEFKRIAFYYLWKDDKIKSFEEFCSDKNIEPRECDGRKWNVFNVNSIYHYIWVTDL